MKKPEWLLKTTAWALIAAMLLQSVMPGAGIAVKAETPGAGISENAVFDMGEAEGECELSPENEAEPETDSAMEMESDDGLGEEIDPQDEIMAEQLVELASEVITKEELFPGFDFTSYTGYGQSEKIGATTNFTAEEKALYDQLAKASLDVMCGRYTAQDGMIYVPLFQAQGITKTEIQRIYYVFMANNPLAFWQDGYTYGKLKDGSYGMSFRIREEYKFYDNLIARWNELLEKLNEYLGTVSKYPDKYRRAKYLYEEITKDKQYEYVDGEISDRTEAHNIEGVLMDKSAVCEGFAKTYSLLLTACGIRNYVVCGWNKEGIGHLWNLVEMDDKVYLCDATWDVEKTVSDWQYFMIGSDKDAGQHIFIRDEVTADVDAKYDHPTLIDDYPIEADDLHAAEPAGDLRTLRIRVNEPDKVTLEARYAGLRMPMQDAGAWADVSGGRVYEIQLYEDDDPGQILMVKADAIGEGKCELCTDRSFSEKAYGSIYLDVDAYLAAISVYYDSLNTDLKSYMPPVTLDVDSFSDDYETVTGSVYCLTEFDDGLSVKIRLKRQPDNYLTDKLYLNDCPSLKAVDVWYDAEHVNELMFPHDLTYMFDEYLDLPENIDANDVCDSLSVSYYNPGCASEFSIKQDDELEVRAYDEDGNRIYSKNLVGIGKKVTLKAFAKNGEVDAEFYCQTDGNTAVKMPGKVLIPVGKTVVSAKPMNHSTTMVSRPKLASSDITVTNGMPAEEIALLLPKETTITTMEGRTLVAEIDWTGALDAYDPQVKEAHDLAIQGTLQLPENVVDTYGFGLQVDATLKIQAAKSAALVEASEVNSSFKLVQVPDSVTVAGGTPKTAQELGLPTVLLFKETDRPTVQNYLKIDWTYDETAKQMKGQVNADGYTVSDEFIVDVTELPDNGITVPGYCSITYMYSNTDKPVDVIYPRKVQKYNASLSITIPEGTDRVITLIVPRGLKDVTIFDAKQIEGVKSTDKEVQEDGSTRVQIALEDTYKAGSNLTGGFTFTTLYNAYDYGMGQMARFAQDLGANYPDGSRVPVRVEYKAKEGAKEGQVNVPLKDADRLKVSHEEDFAVFDPMRVNDLGQFGQLTCQIKAPRFYKFKDTAPYLFRGTEVIPMPEIVASPTQVIAYNEQGNNIRYEYRFDSKYRDERDVEITLKESQPGGLYAGEPIRYIGYDAWGNSFIYDTSGKEKEERVKIKILAMGDEVIVSNDGNILEDSLLKNSFLIYPKGQSVQQAEPIGHFGLKSNDGPVPFQDVKLRVDMPDGVYPTYARIDAYAPALPKEDRTIPPDRITFVYEDDTTKTFSWKLFPNDDAYWGCDLRAVDSDFKDDTKILTAVEFEWDSLITGTESGSTYIDTNFTMEAYDSFRNGDRVPHGTYLNWNEATTDCPFVRGTATLTAGSIQDSFSYGGYLISAGKTHITGFSLKKPDNDSSELNYGQILSRSDDRPVATANGYLLLEKDSLAADYLENLQIILSVVDFFDLKRFKINSNLKTGSTDGIVTLTYSDGESVDKSITELLDDTFLVPEGKKLEEIIILWPDTAFIEEKSASMGFVLQGDVNFEKYEALYGRTNRDEGLVSATVVADGEMPRAMVFGAKIMTSYDVGENVYVSNTVAPTPSYDNTADKNITVASALEQKDGAYLRWPIFGKEEAGKLGKDPKGTSYAHIKKITVRVDRVDDRGWYTTNTQGDFVLGDDCFLEVFGLSHDIDGDGVAERLQEGHKLYPSSVKQVKEAAYDFVFEDFYVYDGYSPGMYFQARIKPTFRTTKNINVKACITEVVAYEEQPQIHPLFSTKMDISYHGVAGGNWYWYPLNVLTAYTEKIEGYGRTEMSTGFSEPRYHVGKQESFTYTTHIFNESANHMDDIEMLIKLPKEGDKLTTDDGIFTQQWAAQFEKLTVPADEQKNYQMYYTTDEKTWKAFNGTQAGVTEGDEPVAVKITADQAFNADEIVLTLKKAEDSAGDAYLSTSYHYKDFKTTTEKNGITKAVLYSGVKEKLLSVPADAVKLGSKKENETMGDVQKQLKLLSEGTSDVENVKVSLVAEDTADHPEAFTTKSIHLKDGVIDKIASGESELLYVGVKKDLKPGNYTASLKLEWTDDDGAHTQTIPISFKVLAKDAEEETYQVSYLANLPDGVTLSGSVPTDAAAYKANDTVSLKDGTAMTVKGYRFAGWALSKNAAPADVIKTASIVMGAGDLRLYAVWEKEAGIPAGPSISENDPKPTVSDNDLQQTVSDNNAITSKPTAVKEPEKPVNANELEKRKDLSILLVKGKAKSTTSVTLTWLKEKKADGYEIYWSYCDGKSNYKKLATVKKNKARTYTHKKLKKTREYKYFVAAYRMEGGKKVYISKSPNVHVAMSFDKRTNVKSISTNKSKVTLSAKGKKYKKSFTVKAKMKLENKKKKALQHVRVLRYYTSDKSVAKVSSNGVITAKGKGKCTIYVIANNGVYKKIAVTVK